MTTGYRIGKMSHQNIMYLAVEHRLNHMEPTLLDEDLI